MFWFALFSLFTSAESQAYTHFIDTTPQQQWSVAYWPKANFPITFAIDKEPVTVEAQDPQTVAESAIALWNQVPGSYVRLQLTRLQHDIHVQNFAKEVKVGDGRYEIIIEQDGNLLESLGLDAKFVAGLGVPITANNTQGKPNSPIFGTIVDAFVIVNTEQAWTLQRFRRLLAHEIGHTLGLAHTNIAHQTDVDKAPLMFYDPTQPKGPVLLHTDDLAGLATLYPNPDFETRFGAIRGQLRSRDNQPAFGVAVIATSKESDGEPTGTWTDQQGNFFLTGLLPGSYTLHARPIDGSRNVHDMDVAVHVGGVYKQANKTFCAEYYNDHPFALCRNEPFQQDRLSVQAGETLVVGTIQEGQGNPSPPLRCEYGSLTRLPNHPLSLSSDVPNKGKRGTACPVALPEQPPEPTAVEPVSVEKTSSPERPDTSATFETLLTPAPCGCNNTPTPFSLILTIALLWLLQRHRSTRTEL